MEQSRQQSGKTLTVGPAHSAEFDATVAELEKKRKKMLHNFDVVL